MRACLRGLVADERLGCSGWVAESSLQSLDCSIWITRSYARIAIADGDR